MATFPKNIYKDLITNDAHIFNDQASMIRPIERDEPRKIFLEVSRPSIRQRSRLQRHRTTENRGSQSRLSDGLLW
jgi:hypothetical protein